MALLTKDGRYVKAEKNGTLYFYRCNEDRDKQKEIMLSNDEIVELYMNILKSYDISFCEKSNIEYTPIKQNTFNYRFIPFHFEKLFIFSEEDKNDTERIGFIDKFKEENQELYNDIINTFNEFDRFLIAYSKGDLTLGAPYPIIKELLDIDVEYNTPKYECISVISHSTDTVEEMYEYLKNNKTLGEVTDC